jgi:putative ABC transport system permease protein
MNVLSLRNIIKTYKHDRQETMILKGINLDIEKGSFVSILGRSGSGKTTLLNVISTLLPYENGELLIDGHDISNESNKTLNQIRNQYIGFVFQEFNLVKDMTVLDNVATPMLLNGVSFKEARERAIDVLTQVGLESYSKVRPVELSGGQQQRVAIARAIANDQQILLCDEPTGALDDQTAKEILDLLKSLSKTKTVIMVTHDEEFAKKYSDRLIMLVDGRIVKDLEINQKLEKTSIESKPLLHRRMGLINTLRYSFVSMMVDKKRFGTTFRTFSLSLTLFIVMSVINQNIDVFIKEYLSFIKTDEAVNQSIILDFLYQFLEQNISQLISAILFILIAFCIISYLFVFTINILNKKKEIAVLKAFGASQTTISLLFMLRPIKFTLAIFKDTFIYTFVAILLINKSISLQSLLVADFWPFVTNFFTVTYGVIASFLINIDLEFALFHIHYSHILYVFFVVLGLFMIGSLIPAFSISRSDTIRLLARE